MNNNELLFGIRAVIEALHSDKQIDKVWIKRNLQSELAKELFDALKQRHITPQRVPLERLNRLSRKNHQGVIARISPISCRSLELLIPNIYEQGRSPFVVLLDGITDVRNLGAIARTCECAAVDALIFPDKRTAPVNADAIKSSAGALLRLPICKQTSLPDTLRFLRDSGLTLIAASEKADIPYTQPDYLNPTALVIGAEDSGIAPNNLRLCHHAVRIPVFGTIPSLNASVAAALLIYEVIRQRQTATLP